MDVKLRETNQSTIFIHVAKLTFSLFCRPVVILADKSKEEMDVEVRASMCAYNLEWHTRSGRPHSLADLRRAAAGQARTVILLDPGGDDDVRILTCSFLGKSLLLWRELLGNIRLLLSAYLSIRAEGSRISGDIGFSFGSLAQTVMIFDLGGDGDVSL